MRELAGKDKIRQDAGDFLGEWLEVLLLFSAEFCQHVVRGIHFFRFVAADADAYAPEFVAHVLDDRFYTVIPGVRTARSGADLAEGDVHFVVRHGNLIVMNFVKAGGFLHRFAAEVHHGGWFDQDHTVVAEDF